MKRQSRDWRGGFNAIPAAGYLLILVSLFLLSEARAWAAPMGQTVVAGQATFERQGALTTIHAGNNSIINYRSFDILAHETVQFIQPDATSRVLNRVLTDGPSSIFGSLLANGQVYIANPAGIYFGKGSYINVGGLVAAAGNISDQDFLKHVNHFTGVGGDLSNLGTIEAGSVSLIGQHVANHGNIAAPNGLVTLLAGDDVLMGESGGHVFVNIGKATSPDTAGVENTGKISAGTGRSILAAGDLYSLAVVNSGVIEAHEITLEGKGTGKVQASGTLDASDRSIGGVGGKIEVLGEKVALSGAKIDASGDAGGGTVLVGGGFHGNGEVRNASRTLVDRDSSIKADAISSGDGGKVVVWSDDTTEFYGTVSAQAFGQSGNGGFAEISGKQHLALSGHAYLAGANGDNGHLLIDPGRVSIIAGTNSPFAFLDVFFDKWITSQLETGGADLIISTANSKSDVSPIEDLIVEASANISYNSANNFTLIGNNSATINGPIVNFGSGSMTISGGQITLNAGIKAPTITLDGAVNGSGLVTANTLNLNGSGDVGFLQPLNTAVGSIFLNKKGGNIIIMDSEDVNISGTTANGYLSLTTPGSITVKNPLDSGSGSIDLSGGQITLNAAVNAATATVTLDGAVDGTGLVTASRLDLFGSGKVGTSAQRLNTRADVINLLKGGGDSFINETGTTKIAGRTGDGALDLKAAGAITVTPSELEQDEQGIDAGSGNVILASVGNITFDSGVHVIADKQSYSAGTGTSGANGAFVQLRGGPNSIPPTFHDHTGQAPPNSFTHRQDATINDANIADISQFGGTAPPTYTIQSDNGAVTLSTAANVKKSALTLSATNSTLTIGAPLDLTSLTAAGASIALNALGTTTTPSVRTSGSPITKGSQAYSGVLTLGAAAVLESTDGSAIAFNSTVDGAQNLAINTSGTTIFGGAVGKNAALASLTTDAGGRTDLNGGPVTTSGGQTYNDDVVLSADTILTGTTMRFNGMVNGASSGGQSLTINGDAIFGNEAGDLVGNAASLHFLTISGATTLNGGATGGNTVTTAHGQTYGGSVTLGADTVLASTSDGDISFNSTVDGARNLQVNTSGATVFGGTVNIASVTTDAGGRTDLNGGPVTTSGGQTYNDDVILSADTILTGTTMRFNGMVNGASPGGQSLTINGDAVFGNEAGDFVGNAASLHFLTISGATTLNGGATGGNTVTTTHGQTYGGSVTLGADTVLASTSDGDISFNSTVDGARNLQVNTSGATVFGGTVNIASVTTDAGGRTDLNGGTVITSGSQTYNDPVALNVNTTLTGVGVVFNSTVDRDGAPRDLTVNAGAGTATFAANIGAGPNGALGALAVNSSGITSISGSANAASVTTDARGRTDLNGGTVITSGAQTYNDPVTLSVDTTLTGTKVAFNGTVDGTTAGNESLTINGNAVFGDGPGDFVGNAASLHFLTVFGDTTFNGGSTGANTVTTVHGQTYNGAVTLGAATVLKSCCGGDITFNSSLSGAQSLEVNTSGTTTFNGAVGSSTDLTTLPTTIMTDVDGATVINANVVTSEDQTYRGRPVILGGNIVLNSTRGNVLFNNQENTENTSRATIYSTSPGIITIDANQFIMGQNEKFVSTAGAITINVKQSATLGDIAAFQDLTINSPDIKLLQRKPVPGTPGDRGLDFVGRSITVTDGKNDGNPPTVNFTGDSAADHTALFGANTFGANSALPKMAAANGVIITSAISGTDPFVPKFDEHGVPIDPQAPFPFNISEALGLIEPVPVEEAPPVLVSPAFTSYENVFSELYLFVLELQNTLGVRNADAARLLTEIETNLQLVRDQHREWATKEDSREHNPEPNYLYCVSDQQIMMASVGVPYDSVAVKLVTYVQEHLSELARTAWAKRHIEVPIDITLDTGDTVDHISCAPIAQIYLVLMNGEKPVDYSIFEKEPTKFVMHQNIKENHFDFTRKPFTRLLGVGRYYFWAVGSKTSSDVARIDVKDRKIGNDPNDSEPVKLKIRTIPDATRDPGN